MAYHAITLKYLGPTNAKGSRISVSQPVAKGVRLNVWSWDNELDPTDNFKEALRSFLEKHNITGEWAMGYSDHDDMVAVRLEAWGELLYNTVTN